jgi:hypothetical protein
MTSHTIHANNYACVEILLVVFCYVVYQFTDLYLVVAFMPNEKNMRNYWHVCYNLSYDSIKATIRQINFSVYEIVQLIDISLLDVNYLGSFWRLSCGIFNFKVFYYFFMHFYQIPTLNDNVADDLSRILNHVISNKKKNQYRINFRISEFGKVGTN